MKVVRTIVPGIEHPDAAAAARAYAGDDFHEVALEWPESYFELGRELWHEQQTFMFLEHDIVIRPGIVEDLASCPCWWGGYAYLLMGTAFSAAFGCTKFDARLMRLYPNLWDDMLAEYDLIPGFAHEAGGPKHWRHLDSRIAWMLERVYGFGVICTHWPPVVHLNPTMMAGRDPYELARQGPHPMTHHCIDGHFCRCLLGVNDHPCPARSNMDGSGVIVHCQPRLATSGQEAPIGLL